MAAGGPGHIDAKRLTILMYWGDARTVTGAKGPGIQDWIANVENVARGADPVWTNAKTATMASQAFQGQALTWFNLVCKGSYDQVDSTSWISLKEGLVKRFGIQATPGELAGVVHTLKQGHYDSNETVDQWMDRLYEAAYLLDEGSTALPAALTEEQKRQVQLCRREDFVLLHFLAGLNENVKMIVAQRQYATPALAREAARLAEASLREKHPGKNPYKAETKQPRTFEVGMDDDTPTEEDKDKAPAADSSLDDKVEKLIAKVDGMQTRWQQNNRGRGRGRGRGQGRGRGFYNHRGGRQGNRNWNQGNQGNQGNTFQGQCYNCHGYGHSRRFCPSGPQPQPQQPPPATNQTSGVWMNNGDGPMGPHDGWMLGN